ncbi:hypothetical protein EHQ92_09425 [Leptospira biflexa]|nr:hypothetical protein EHQ89_12540 [Leptospira biflexa]TGM40375.1 hypothetical protein EHQ80_03795 [Leptospira biflexa]TGM48788.1 hypothetical protein EHQ92_09425 [Leptospira biflexa]TGM51143.1 hypothetical protein EHQ88_03655 [Leptospira biflexa]TGM56418.1 hypothetical protein EHQ91_07005 [Leptospira biflexa]
MIFNAVAELNAGRQGWFVVKLAYSLASDKMAISSSKLTEFTFDSWIRSCASISATIIFLLGSLRNLSRITISFLNTVLLSGKLLLIEFPRKGLWWFRTSVRISCVISGAARVIK